MLKNTFCHIKGISENTEKNLWKNSILTWDDFINNFEKIENHIISINKKKYLKNEIYFSIEMLKEKNLNYFKKNLHSKNHYRLYNYGKVGFLDIETTGLSKYTDEITLIGIYDGLNSYQYILNENLNEAIDKLKEFDIIVTFNGKCFDVPFIEFKFNQKFDFIHLDLRYLLKEFNLSGGLKKIEKELGINRNEEIANVDGFEAVRLWKKYLNGDKLALQKLLKYNKEDIENLKILIEWYLQRKKEKLFNNLN